MIRHLRTRLTDIRDNIQLIADISKGRTRRHLEHDVVYRYAVHHAVLIITDAVQHLSPELRARHPSAPWREIEIAGNSLRQDYCRTDSVVIWSVIKTHLLELDRAIEEIAEEALQGT